MYFTTNRMYVEKMKLIGTVVAVEFQTGSWEPGSWRGGNDSIVHIYIYPIETGGESRFSLGFI